MFEQRATIRRVASAASASNNYIRPLVAIASHHMVAPTGCSNMPWGCPCGCSKFSFSRPRSLAGFTHLFHHLLFHQVLEGVHADPMMFVHLMYRLVCTDFSLPRAIRRLQSWQLPLLLLRKRVSYENAKDTLRFNTNNATLKLSPSVQFENVVWLPLRVFERPRLLRSLGLRTWR